MPLYNLHLSSPVHAIVFTQEGRKDFLPDGAPGGFEWDGPFFQSILYLPVFFLAMTSPILLPTGVMPLE